MNSFIRWTACAAVVLVLILGYKNRDFEPSTGLDAKAIASDELLKRQPLNRNVFSNLLREQISQYGAESSNEALLKQSFAVAEVLHARDARNDLARLYDALAGFQKGGEGDFLDSVKLVFSTENYHAQLRYGKMIAQQVHNDNFFKALKSELKNRPTWGPIVIKAIMQTDTRNLLDLMDMVRLYPELRGAYLLNIRRKVSTAQAYDAFLKLLGEGDLPATIPYNPTLEVLDTPAPFNWNKNTSITESLPRNGVLVTKLSGQAEYVLSQIIPPLDVGEYSLRVRMNGSSLPYEAYWQWVLNCEGENKTVLNSKVTKTSMRPREYDFPFSINSKQCGFINIVFNAVPGSVKRSFEAEIIKITIVKK